MPYKDPQKRAEYHKQYNKKYTKTPKGKRITKIKEWKFVGLISDDYNAVYDRWLNTKNCDCCNKILTATGNTRKSMDHCHKTGKFRNILCHNCNIMRFHKDNNYQAYLKMLTMD